MELRFIILFQCMREARGRGLGLLSKLYVNGKFVCKMVFAACIVAVKFIFAEKVDLKPTLT